MYWWHRSDRGGSKRLPGHVAVTYTPIQGKVGFWRNHGVAVGMCLFAFAVSLFVLIYGWNNGLLIGGLLYLSLAVGAVFITGLLPLHIYLRYRKLERVVDDAVAQKELSEKDKAQIEDAYRDSLLKYDDPKVLRGQAIKAAVARFCILFVILLPFSVWLGPDLFAAFVLPFRGEITRGYPSGSGFSYQYLGEYHSCSPSVDRRSRGSDFRVAFDPEYPSVCRGAAWVGRLSFDEWVVVGPMLLIFGLYLASIVVPAIRARRRRQVVDMPE